MFFYVSRFFCLSAVTLKKDPLPDQKKKHPLALVCSVNTDLFLKDTSILQNENRVSSGVYFHVVASRGRGRSPVMLRAHGWRSKVIGHLLIQTTLHPFLQSCSLLHKQQFLLKQQLHRQTGEPMWSLGGRFARRPVRTLLFSHVACPATM